MKAMILAAGQGTRLRPLTETVPKPMIPIVGTPLLAHTLSWLGRQGVDEAAINLFHRPESIPEYFGATYAGVRLHYFFEDTLRGTSGGVKGAESVLRGGPFYVIYGDNLVSADLPRLLRFHEQSGAIATLALFAHPNPSAAGIVGIDSAGFVTAFVEKPPPDRIFSDQANAGVYVCSEGILDWIPADVPSDFGRDIFPNLLESGIPLAGLPLNGYLQDTGTPEQYRKANWDALGGATGLSIPDSRVWLGPHSRVDDTAIFLGKNVVGQGTEVGAGATLTDTIVWDNVTLGAGCVLTEAIVGQGVVIADGAIVPPGTILGSGAKYPAWH